MCQGIFCYIQNAVSTRVLKALLYSECCERSSTESPAIFRTLPYSEFWHISNLRHIQKNPAYLGMFSNDSNTRLLFFDFNLTYFLTKVKKTCLLTTMTSISRLGRVY